MKISSDKIVFAAEDRSTAPPAQPPAEHAAHRPAPDSVGSKVEHNPLLRLRAELIQTSAHAVHPTAKSVAEALQINKKIGGIVGAGLSAAAAWPQFQRAYAQDGGRLGSHVGNVAGHVAAGVGGGIVGGLIGSQAGEVVGAFAGGPFGGIGAIPGAMIGGVIGGTIGGYVGSKMALDDLNSLETALGKHHA